MARINAPLIAFNRGLIAKEALARIDLDRTRLSAEIMNNWLPKTQGAMIIRPGTKHLGSSYNDTGAMLVGFVAATDDTALLEFTPLKMRVWIDDALLGRPKVDTTVTLSDTGWSDSSTGGVVATTLTDRIPQMTNYTTDGVTLSFSSDNVDIDPGWAIADDDIDTRWSDTGGGGSALPSWVNVDFGSGNTKTIRSYSLRAANAGGFLDNAPTAWTLLGYDTDTGVGTIEDTQSGQTGWGVSEKRTFTLSDTGTADSWRNWKLTFTAVDGDTELFISELELFEAATAQQVAFNAQGVVLNATAEGSFAKASKRVVVDTGDVNIEHSFAMRVEPGPVTLRCGSSLEDDDYINETTLGTGYHNLAFTPTSDFYITLQTSEIVNRTVKSLTIGDSGTVEITTPYAAANLDNIRETQSADVLYLDCNGVKPYKVERRGTGRSWSVVEFNSLYGPFLPFASTSAMLSVSQTYGNTVMNSDSPFFKSSHDGALIRIFHEGQSGVWNLGALDAISDAIKITGIDEDAPEVAANNERRVVFAISGTYSGEVTIQRSFDGPESGFHDSTSSDATDTGTFTFTHDDSDDNITVWYRAKLTSYSSGVAVVTATYKSGGVTGIARVTTYRSNTEVDVEVLRRFSDTGPSDSWQEGSWSGVQGYPTSVALHEGRLAHAGKANIYLSVSDDYENYDDTTVGDAGPINKTLGTGPVDNIYFLLSLLRLILGTAGAELGIRASSLDEALTPSNASVKPFSTQGSANIRALQLDSSAVYVQRSGQRVYKVGFGTGLDAVGDYESSELTFLVPRLLEAGVVSIAIQRQPDTRIHCVLTDGTVGILTYEPQEEVLAWSTWSTDTGTAGAVEKARTLPGAEEDSVYYLVRRTINGSTKRYLEKWAKESETRGDTGLSWIMDCAASYTDTGRASTVTGFSHLAGSNIIGWADDTGQTNAGKDLSPDDTGGDQTKYAVDTGTGSVVLSEDVHHFVGGLGFNADYKSAKLAYAAQAGTALAQMKRADKMAFVLSQTHNNALFFGNDTGQLDPLPRVTDEGAVVDADKIFESFDQMSIPFPGLWDTDSRIFIRAKAPRPATVMGVVPTVGTQEKV